MKILLAGASGVLGTDILRELVENTQHEIIACCRDSSKLDQSIDRSRVKVVLIDVTKPETLKGICDGVDIVISTVGLTTSSTVYTNFDIDYRGNLNLLNEAKSAGVKYFNYVSVVGTDLPFKEISDVSMVLSKSRFEKALKNSEMNYTIYRPTGFFYDIAKVFKPMIQKGKVQLIKCKVEPKCNVVDTEDFAKFIVDNMKSENAIFNVGGKETYTYREIAIMFFESMDKKPKISYSPAMMMDVLSNLPKIKKEGKRDVILFGKFTMTHDCIGDTIVGDKSFSQYIESKRYLF